MKSSGVEWIGEIPENWESIRLKYIYSTTKAKLPKQFYDDKNLTPYLSMDFIRDTINTEPVYAKDGDYCSEEDILILWDGSNAGEIVFNHPAGYAPSTTAILKKLSTQSLPVYDKFYLKALEDDLRRNTNGMGIPHVNGSYLNNSLFLLPPKSTQQRIASYLDKKCSKIEETIQNQQQVIEKLKAYKQSLITEAVTGKIKIQNGKVCGEYESYKDSGVEWLGKIPSEWKKCKFTRIIIDTRNGLSRRDLNKSTGNLVLKLKNINPDGNIDLTETNRIELSKNEIQNYQLQNDDFLFVRVNGSKSLVGKCAIYKTIENIVAYNDHIIRVRFNLNLCNVYYIKYLLQSSYAKYDIANHIKTAAGQFTISSEDLCNLICLLPSIDEQKSIADYLNKKCLAIDNAIEQKQKLIEKLAEYKKSLIYECVTGKKEC